jgi:nucleoid DNA-binding protein
MSSITKADIVEKISKSTGISKVETKAVVEGIVASIVEAIIEGNKVELRGFGVFNSKKRKPRKARNPRTGEIVELKERNEPLFKPSTDFAQKVNENLSK